MPIPVAEIKVIDENGEECAPGQVGQLLIKGPTVIEGYWNNEEANRRSFTDGFWCSGDIAVIDGDGFVYIMDRMKDMINRGGEKIFSIEVENVLYNHPGILEAAVVGVPDRIYGETVKAFVVPKADVQIEEEEVKQFVRERLAEYKVPTAVEFIPELPRNPGGKIIKSYLKNGLLYK
jgi:long-chain acyl-CoA synthetase